MRISVTEPSSVILSQTRKIQKLGGGIPKVPKQAEIQEETSTKMYRDT